LGEPAMSGWAGRMPVSSTATTTLASPVLVSRRWAGRSRRAPGRRPCRGRSSATAPGSAGRSGWPRSPGNSWAGRMRRRTAPRAPRLCRAFTARRRPRSPLGWGRVARRSRRRR
jgi:hypothetical protein